MVFYSADEQYGATQAHRDANAKLVGTFNLDMFWGERFPRLIRLEAAYQLNKIWSKSYVSRANFLSYICSSEASGHTPIEWWESSVNLKPVKVV